MSQTINHVSARTEMIYGKVVYGLAQLGPSAFLALPPFPPARTGAWGVSPVSPPTTHLASPPPQNNPLGPSQHPPLALAATTTRGVARLLLGVLLPLECPAAALGGSFRGLASRPRWLVGWVEWVGGAESATPVPTFRQNASCVRGDWLLGKSTKRLTFLFLRLVFTLPGGDQGV